MKSNWKFFTLEELKCHCDKCGSTGLEMHPEFMEKIVELREILNFPFIINSAYRCPQYNLEVSHTGLTGPHTTGRAMDIECDGYKSYLIMEEAMNLKFTGFGISQKDGKPRYVHIDLCQSPEFPRPTTWSY